MILSPKTKTEIKKDAEAIAHMLSVDHGHVELHYYRGRLSSVVTVDKSIKYERD